MSDELDRHFVHAALEPPLGNETLAKSGLRQVLGKTLPLDHGYPARIIIPKLYAWKGAKFVRQIEFTAEDKLGFWEVRGYSNTADPWTEDRFS